MKSKKIISFIVTMVLIITILPCSIARANTTVNSQPISLGHSKAAIIKEDGSLWLRGYYQFKDESWASVRKKPEKVMDNVIGVSVGSPESAAIKKDGSLWVWNDEKYVKHGDGSAKESFNPIKIMDDVTMVSMGDNHYGGAYGGTTNMVIKKDRSLWLWGSNNYGQIGNGTYDEPDKPIKIMDDIINAATSGSHSAAIKDDGTLWMWGFNYHGQLGDGSNEDKNQPIKIMDDVANVSLYGCTSAAIKSDGSLWMWGSKYHGQTEDGVSTNIPIKISDDVQSVSLGSDHGAFIKKDGSLWTWGWGGAGCLGNGDDKNAFPPVKIMDNVAFVSLGYCDSAAIKTDGSLYVWGNNQWNQLSEEDIDVIERPIKIMDSVMMPTNATPNTQISTAVPENNPTLSDTTPQSIGLSEEKKLTAYIDGIYSEVDEKNFSVKSSNENVIAISKYEADCGSVSDPFDESDVAYLTSVGTYVIGKNPGDAVLTYYYKDKEIGKVNVTVEAQIAETINNETVLKAEILNRNHSFELFRNTLQSPAVKLNQTFRDNSTQEWAAAYMFTYELSKVLSLNFPDIEKFDMQSYYEAVLTDILENDNESVWSDFYDNWKAIYKGYNNKLLQEIIKSVPDFEKYKNSNLAKETDIKIVLDKIEDTKGELKDIKIEKNLFETFGFCYDTITDTFDEIDEIYAYSAVQQEKIDVLKEIRDNTENKELKKACDATINRIQDVHKNVVTAFLKGESIAVGKNILEFSHSVTVDLFLQVKKTTKAADIIKDYSRGKLIMSSARLATDLIMNSTNVSKDTLTMAAYSDIESELKKCINIRQQAFENNKTEDTARAYIATADVFKAALLTSCDAYAKCIKNTKRGEKGMEITSIIGTSGISYIFDIFFGKDIDYDAKIEQANNFKQSIAETDFYSTDGYDVAEFITNIESATPSEWAKEYIERAISTHYILPEYLQGNYQNNITRAEFCTLLSNTIEMYTLKGMDQLIAEAPYNPRIFKDTCYEYVYYMSCLGIVNGVNETDFNPLGEISREEAATMLMRAAKVVGCDISAPATNLQGVSNWATDGVNFVVDRGIMTGTDVGFEPQGKYTKEQAITTFVRFIENLK